MMACALLVGMNACKSNSSKAEPTATADNSRNSLDWDGTYYGVLPCADCPGIETIITLKADNTYEITSHYQGTGEEDILAHAGEFQWAEDGSSVILKNADKNNDSRKLKVGENKLFWLDADGKMISGELAENYILRKVNSELVEKYWKLIEIFGESIKPGDTQSDAYITLHTLGNRVNGNLGCNSFFGKYELRGENQIKFSSVGSTMMMCMNITVEDKMKQVLERADSYYAQNDTLVLNRARMAPLARFVAVYM